MWQLEDKMKKILVLVLFLVSCNTEKSNQSFNIPVFDSNQAFTYLKEQCEFGPRNPGSDGAINFTNYLNSFLRICTYHLYINIYIVDNGYHI